MKLSVEEVKGTVIESPEDFWDGLILVLVKGFEPAGLISEYPQIEKPQRYLHSGKSFYLADPKLKPLGDLKAVRKVQKVY